MAGLRARSFVTKCFVQKTNVDGFLTNGNEGMDAHALEFVVHDMAASFHCDGASPLSEGSGAVLFASLILE